MRLSFGARAWAAALLAVAVALPTGCGRRRPEGQRPEQPVGTDAAPVPASQAASEQTAAARPVPPAREASGPHAPGTPPGITGTVTIEKRPGGATWTLTDQSGHTTTTTTTTTVTEADLGVRFYPGAVVVSGGKTSSGDGGGSWAAVELLTRDPFDKVAAFYRQAYAKGNQVAEGAGWLTIIVGSREQGSKTITVSHESGAAGTHIALSSGS